MNTDNDGITADSIFEYIKNLESLLKKSESIIEYLRNCRRNEELKHAETRSELVAFKNACVRAPAGTLFLPTKENNCRESVKKPLSLSSGYLLSLKLCRSVLLL